MYFLEFGSAEYISYQGEYDSQDCLHLFTNLPESLNIAKSILGFEISCWSRPIAHPRSNMQRAYFVEVFCLLCTTSGH